MTEKRKISAKIVADSVDPRGNRITTFILIYPRMIHAELLTHRLFSRNAASSRAIPFKKMVEDVENDPFIPIAWQKDHKGMQGVEYFIEEIRINNLRKNWIEASRLAVEEAKSLNNSELTKQLCNRLLEPFQWYTCLVTATEFDNFFELRCPQYEVSWYPSSRPEALEPTQTTFFSKKDAIVKTEGECKNWTESQWRESNYGQAEIHIQALAEAMWDAKNESTPKELKAGEWHIPFGDKIIKKYNDDIRKDNAPAGLSCNDSTNITLKIATARCARLSYMTFDGEIDYEKDIKLHDQLLESEHYSPFEHCCCVMSDKEYYSFIKGKVPTQIDEYGITNLEMMPFSSGDPIVGFKGLNPKNGNKYGWCNNIKGFIQYRYLLENE